MLPLCCIGGSRSKENAMADTAAPVSVPEKVFVLCYYQHPGGGANSGEVTGQEITEKVARDEFTPRRHPELAAFLDAAAVGDYLQADGRFIFRRK